MSWRDSVFQEAWAIVKYDWGEDIPEPIRRTKQIQPSAHSHGETMTPEEIESLRVNPKWPRGTKITPWDKMNPGMNQRELMQEAHLFLGGNPNYGLKEIDEKGPWFYTSKMPGPASGIPTHFCPVGRRLRQGDDKTCSECNVHGKGTAGIPAQREKFYRQYRGLSDTERWASAASYMMPHHANRHKSILMDMEPNFRHHYSGDLQNIDHLRMINAIADYDPSIRHWLPTLERKNVARFMNEGMNPLARNLELSLSAPPKKQSADDYELESLMRYPQLGHPQISFTGLTGTEEQACPGECIPEGCNRCFMGGGNVAWENKLSSGKVPADIVETPVDVQQQIAAIRRGSWGQ